MGYGIGRSLLRAGFTVQGFEIEPARVAMFVDEGGHSRKIADLPGALDVLILVVVNQLLAGVHIAAAAEAITFAQSIEMSAAQTIDVISKCARTIWMFENRGPHIVDGDYTPHSAIDIFVKNLGIVTDMALALKSGNFGRVDLFAHAAQVLSDG